jgi:penicillin-binding protein-related factor A (putative recombinase)
MIGTGRAVYVETKRVSSGPFELRDLRVSQIAELSNAWAGGALAFVLVIHGPKKVPCVLPWTRIRHEFEARAKSISVDELMIYEVTGPYLAPWASK